MFAQFCRLLVFYVINELLWAFERVLNSPSVRPTYVCFCPEASVTVAWYTTDFCMHAPFNGHLSFCLQLHSFWLSFSGFAFVSFLLCPSIIVSMLGMQQYKSLIVFLLIILLSLLPFGKHWSIKLKYLLPRFMFKLASYGGLNHVTFLSLFRVERSGFGDIYIGHSEQ